MKTAFLGKKRVLDPGRAKIKFLWECKNVRNDDPVPE
jgi:hypothetical protein